LHNKPLGCGASEVYASGPACEEGEGETRHAMYILRCDRAIIVAAGRRQVLHIYIGYL